MYLAILGRQPELGLLELESRYQQVEPWGAEAAILSARPEVASLGGTIKAGWVLYRGPHLPLTELDLPHLLASYRPLPHRPQFGLSFYGFNLRPAAILKAGLELKRQLGPARFVAPQGSALTAAQLKFHGLLSRGFELLMVKSASNLVVALTEQFQDIDWYTLRDRGRPVRNAKVGMLPPKLAQILVNTTTGQVYDPFCGTGVIIQEALLLGRAAAGSDLDPQMVAATQQNLAWLSQQRSTLPAALVTLADARNVRLPDAAAIVSEGDLGPPLTASPTAAQIRHLSATIMPHYQDALSNFGRQQTTGGQLTICLPAWRTDHTWQTLPLIDQVDTFGYTVRRFDAVDSHALVYHRPEQIVGRQILILRKN